MGRVPTRNLHLPKGMRARWKNGVAYYSYETGGRPRREISLGTNYTEAIRLWAIEAECRAIGGIVTFEDLADRYLKEAIPLKAPATQEINRRELANLRAVFCLVKIPIDDIDPIDVRQYMDTRRSAPYAANREKALLSHMFNFARNAGLTSKANPCTGIKGFKEPGRDAYIQDDVYLAVWECSEPALRDALDLAYLTGQRPADVLKLSRADVRDGEMTIVQNKTGTKLRVEITGELAEVMDRINSRKVMSMAVICDERGRRLTKFGLRGAFDRARDMAIEASTIAAECASLPDISPSIRAFQFRDLRAKAGTDTEELHGMAAAKDQLGHSSEGMTAHYVRHRRGKLVKPTK